MTIEMISDFANAIKKAGVSVSQNVSGSTLTTYRIGGNIDFCVHVQNLKDIEAICKVVDYGFINQLTSENVVTVGKGSNIIVSDLGFDGCVFLLEGEFSSQFKTTQTDNEQIKIEVGAGMALPVFARQCAAESVAGLEFYVGIPGSVGGAIAMNAGGHGKQTSDVLLSCETLNLSTGIVEKFLSSSCDFDYRHSRFSQTDVIFSASYQGIKGETQVSKNEIDSIVSWRRQNQPGGRNVGSVFQNPIEKSAGQLIEECGLKGFRVGGAHVSDKHANFIQADEGATASDLRALIGQIQSKVKDSTGYELKTEVRYIGKYEDG